MDSQGHGRRAAWLAMPAAIIVASSLFAGCQVASTASIRAFPGADRASLWLAARSVAHRDWNVVSEDSTRGALVAVAGQSPGERERPFEYQIRVSSVEGGGQVSVLCRSDYFGRQVDMEKLYLDEVAAKHAFLVPRPEPYVEPSKSDGRQEEDGADEGGRP